MASGAASRGAAAAATTAAALKGGASVAPEFLRRRDRSSELTLVCGNGERPTGRKPRWECRFMSTPAKPFGAGRGDGESVRSPYAPKRSRAGADSPLDGLDDPPPPRFLVSSRDGEREDLTDFTESSLQFRESPLSQSTTRRSAFSERRSYSGSEHARGDSTDDIDLQRLEESVRRLQREAAVSRTRPAADEQFGGQTADARVPRRRDTYIDGYRVPPSLQPEVLTPPAELREGRGRLWTVMSMLLASAVAAPIAYYFAAGSSSSDPRTASVESRPTVETLTVTAPADPARPARSQERVDVAAVPEASPVTVVPRRTAPPSEPQRVERTPPAPPPQRVTPPAQAERTPPPAQRVTPPPPAQAERAPPP